MAATFDQPEHRLSSFVDSLLDRIVVVDAPAWWTAVDTGTIMVIKSREARMNWEQKRRARGIKPAHLDWYLYQEPRYTQFELKYGDKDASPGQDGTMTGLQRVGIPTAVCNSVLSVYEHLKRAGFRLHGNAHNIAIEIEARWRAADSAARPAPKKRRGGPVKPKGLPPSVEDVMGWT